MGPRIKRSKPNSQAPTAPAEPRDQQAQTQAQAQAQQQEHQQQQQQQQQHPRPRPQDPQDSPHIAKLRDTFASARPAAASSSKQTTAPDTDTDDNRSVKSQRRSSRPQSWYKGGSWRAKASPVAQATRESISVAGGATNEALAEGTGQVGRYMNNTLKRQSTKSIPSLPSATRINATRTSSELDMFRSREKKKLPVEEGEDTNDAAAAAAAVKEPPPPPPPAVPRDVLLEAAPAPLPPDPAKDNASQTDTSSIGPPAQKGWFGWWSRPDDYTAEQEKANDAAVQEISTEMVEARTTPLPDTPAPVPNDPIEETGTADNQPTTPIRIEAAVKTTASRLGDAAYGSTRSWFGLWSKAQNGEAQAQDESMQPQPSPPEASPPPDPPVATGEEEAAKSGETLAANTPVTNTAADKQFHDSPPRGKSAGWAFWSRESHDGHSSTPNGTERQIGELAVADTPSQSHPEAAQFNQERERKTKARKGSKAAKAKESTLSRVARLDSTAETPTESPPSSRPPTPEPAKALDLSKPADPAKPADASKPLDASKSLDVASKPAAAKAAPKSANRPPNMVMPSFRDTYTTAQIPTYWERVTQYVASSLHLIDLPASENHVAIAPVLPRVKNAVAIGVHGYFPAPLIQKVLGPPTGTSIRFANHASAAIRAWVEENQPDQACEIETVALEGEGFIADRVNTLWKLLLNWLSHLRQADLIFVACHSQGVPVAIMLVSKLIQLGCLSPHAKIGICAMAGVNLGPFADYKSRLLGAGSAAELFEFSRPGSKVSMEYASALDVVLRHSVRITYVGSIDDQLVSLESSTFTTLTHPYVYRAVFVDGRVHAPDFITHLVSFVLRLRNLGISDHNLIRELSLPLAGSIYGGQGHSTVYDDQDVYRLALSFCLETTDVAPSPAHAAKIEEAQAKRSSRGGPPSSVTAANALRRGSMSAAAVTGIAPTIVPFEMPASGSNSNPYFLPWALRGILEEDVVKRDMRQEVLDLVERFEEWKPVSKVLKDVRFRLEGVRQSYGSKL